MLHQSASVVQIGEGPLISIVLESSNMKSPQAVRALAALAQDTRLAIYRLLVQQGPTGLAAGTIAAADMM